MLTLREFDRIVDGMGELSQIGFTDGLKLGYIMTLGLGWEEDKVKI